MPVVATVDGVSILFYANEHPPPHFHARIAEFRAVIDIDELRVTHGSLPVAKRRHVLAWASTRQASLRAAFKLSSGHGKVGDLT